MKIKIYTPFKTELIGEYNARMLFDDTFYHRNMPTLSAKLCGKILNTISPHFKIDSEEFLIENLETGYMGVQRIFRDGTILNF